MILAVGTGVYTAAFFHLLTHAMFKANLFYCSGSVIHSMHHALHKKHDHDTDPQDMRNMGGFKSKMPITYWSMLKHARNCWSSCFFWVLVKRCYSCWYISICPAPSGTFFITNFRFWSSGDNGLLYVSFNFYDLPW